MSSRCWARLWFQTTVPTPQEVSGYARACGAVGYCIDDPARAEEVLREAFAQPGPVVIEAVVDPNGPPLPGKSTTEQMLKFSEALARGEKDRFAIIKDVLEDKVREVV